MTVLTVYRKVIAVDPLRFGRFHVLLGPCSHLLILAKPPKTKTFRCSACERDLKEYTENGRVSVAKARQRLDHSISRRGGNAS